MENKIIKYQPNELIKRADNYLEHLDLLTSKYSQSEKVFSTRQLKLISFLIGLKPLAISMISLRYPLKEKTIYQNIAMLDWSKLSFNSKLKWY